MLFNDRRKDMQANARALKKAQGKSLAPRGYKSDACSREFVQTSVALDRTGARPFNYSNAAKDLDILQAKNAKTKRTYIAKDDHEYDRTVPSAPKNRQKLGKIIPRKKKKVM